MKSRTITDGSGSQARIFRALTLVYTFAVSMFAVNVPMIGAEFDTISPVRQGAALLLLIFLILLERPVLPLGRELAIYASFTAYMFVTLIWTPSAAVGMNTLLPALNFILLLLLFGTLVSFHDLRAVILGSFVGFVLGAVAYTRMTGFPFIYPPEFSYNAIAAMYLNGLFLTFLMGWYLRWRLIAIVSGLTTMALIAATTSIKTNLGVVLGAGAASLLYSRSVLRLLGRNFVILGLLVATLVYAIASNDGVLERVQNGLDRVSHGAEILERREDATGYTSLNDRTEWSNQGIRGWARSPIFGNGVEAFRTDYGITSHSTPIDLLYNTGVIGFVLFYGIFLSLTLRLLKARGLELGGLPALIFAGLACYGFMTLSEPMHYNSFLAIFLAFSIGLLKRLDPTVQSSPVTVEARS